MKRPHLLSVDAEPSAFAALIEVAEAAGYRVGWLDLDSSMAVPDPVAEALTAGALRSVSVTSEGAIAAKRRRGGWVLDDLLREYFVGFRCVFVIGGPESSVAGTIKPSATGEWTLVTGTAARTVNAESFLSWLRKPLKSRIPDHGNG